MNINPSAAAPVAGVARAAARGGEADNQATEATRHQEIQEKPAGKSPEAGVDAGDQTEDRGGDGRQVLDTFERSDRENSEEQDQQAEETVSPNYPADDRPGGQLDIEV